MQTQTTEALLALYSAFVEAGLLVLAAQVVGELLSRGVEF